MVQIKFKEELYNSELILMIDCDKEEVLKKINRKFPEDPLTIAHRADGCYFRYGNQSYIWVACMDYSTTALSVLAHEVFHYTIDVLYSRGVVLTTSSDEAYAYFYQFAYQELLEGIMNKVEQPKAKKKKKGKKRGRKKKE